MKIYIDLFFLFNVIMDYIIVLGTSVVLKRVSSRKRIFISSLLGGVGSLFLFSGVNKFFIEVVLIILMSLVAFGYRDYKYTIRNIFYLYFISTLLGGIIYLFNIRVSNSSMLTYLIIIVISIEVSILYVKEVKRIKNIYNNCYRVDIYFRDGEVVSVSGFVDTGNNLYEPYKRRPVILLSKRYMRDDNYVLVPYYTASGDGLLKCVRPDRVYIDGFLCECDLLVGFSDLNNLIEGVDVILHRDIMKG